MLLRDDVQDDRLVRFHIRIVDPVPIIHVGSLRIVGEGVIGIMDTHDLLSSIVHARERSIWAEEGNDPSIPTESHTLHSQGQLKNAVWVPIVQVCVILQLLGPGRRRSVSSSPIDDRDDLSDSESFGKSPKLKRY